MDAADLVNVLATVASYLSHDTPGSAKHRPIPATSKTKVPNFYSGMPNVSALAHALPALVGELRTHLAKLGSEKEGLLRELAETRTVLREMTHLCGQQRDELEHLRGGVWRPSLSVREAENPLPLTVPSFTAAREIDRPIKFGDAPVSIRAETGRRQLRPTVVELQIPGDTLSRRKEPEPPVALPDDDHAKFGIYGSSSTAPLADRLPAVSGRRVAFAVADNGREAGFAGAGPGVATLLPPRALEQSSGAKEAGTDRARVDDSLTAPALAPAPRLEQLLGQAERRADAFSDGVRSRYYAHHLCADFGVVSFEVAPSLATAVAPHAGVARAGAGAGAGAGAVSGAGGVPGDAAAPAAAKTTATPAVASAEASGPASLLQPAVAPVPPPALPDAGLHRELDGARAEGRFLAERCRRLEATITALQEVLAAQREAMDGMAAAADARRLDRLALLRGAVQAAAAAPAQASAAGHDSAASSGRRAGRLESETDAPSTSSADADADAGVTALERRLRDQLRIRSGGAGMGGGAESDALAADRALERYRSERSRSAPSDGHHGRGDGDQYAARHGYGDGEHSHGDAPGDRDDEDEFAYERDGAAASRAGVYGRVYDDDDCAPDDDGRQGQDDSARLYTSSAGDGSADDNHDHHDHQDHHDGRDDQHWDHHEAEDGGDGGLGSPPGAGGFAVSQVEAERARRQRSTAGTDHSGRDSGRASTAGALRTPPITSAAARLSGGYASASAPASGGTYSSDSSGSSLSTGSRSHAPSRDSGLPPRSPVLHQQLAMAMARSRHGHAGPGGHSGHGSSAGTASPLTHSGMTAEPATAAAAPAERCA